MNDNKVGYTPPLEKERDEAREAVIREATKEVPNWFRRVRKVVYPEKISEFRDFVSTRINKTELFDPVRSVENVLAIMERLEEDVPEKEYEKLLGDTHSGSSEGMVRNMVARLHKKGPEFYRKTAKWELSPEQEAHLTIFEAENEVLAEIHGEK